VIAHADRGNGTGSTIDVLGRPGRASDPAANKMLRRSAHKSIAAHTNDSNEWITAWNNSPKPFV
jgi:hypothetical protein